MYEDLTAKQAHRKLKENIIKLGRIKADNDSIADFLRSIKLSSDSELPAFLKRVAENREDDRFFVDRDDYFPNDPNILEADVGICDLSEIRIKPINKQFDFIQPRISIIPSKMDECYAIKELINTDMFSFANSLNIKYFEELIYISNYTNAYMDVLSDEQNLAVVNEMYRGVERTQEEKREYSELCNDLYRIIKELSKHDDLSNLEIGYEILEEGTKRILRKENLWGLEHFKNRLVELNKQDVKDILIARKGEFLKSFLIASETKGFNPDHRIFTLGNKERKFMNDFYGDIYENIVKTSNSQDKKQEFDLL